MSDRSDPDSHEQRIRERAYALWDADGRPHGQDVEYWERARALVGMEENPGAGQIPNPVHPGEDRPYTPPPVEEASIQENLGEFPDRLSDQGEHQAFPVGHRHHAEPPIAPPPAKQGKAAERTQAATPKPAAAAEPKKSKGAKPTSSKRR